LASSLKTSVSCIVILVKTPLQRKELACKKLH
jgi:hypothetical protein